MIYTVWPEEIGTLSETGPPGCHWCGGRCYECARTAAGAVICDGCILLAYEVGDGMLSITHLEATYERVKGAMQCDVTQLAADLRTPLRLRLCVQYDGEGSCWLEGLPADSEARAIMDDLVLYEDDGTLGVNGGTRADLERAAGASALQDYAESLQVLLNHDWGPHGEEWYRETVTRYRRRLRPCTCDHEPSMDHAQQPQDQDHDEDRAQRGPAPVAEGAVAPAAEEDGQHSDDQQDGQQAHA